MGAYTLAGVWGVLLVVTSVLAVVYAEYVRRLPNDMALNLQYALYLLGACWSIRMLLYVLLGV